MSDGVHVVCGNCGGVNRVPRARIEEDPKCGKCKASLLKGPPTELTEQTFDPFIGRNELPVVVDFWADWCAPCKTLLPAVESVAEQFKGRLRVGKVNVEENEHVPFQYNITTLPTLLIIKGGKVSEQRVGLISRDNLVKLIEPHLG